MPTAPPSLVGRHTHKVQQQCTAKLVLTTYAARAGAPPEAEGMLIKYFVATGHGKEVCKHNSLKMQASLGPKRCSLLAASSISIHFGIIGDNPKAQANNCGVPSRHMYCWPHSYIQHSCRGAAYEHNLANFVESFMQQ